MKTGIHPQYDDVVINCVCGATFKAGSTQKGLKTEICSKCHPFYTGEKRLVDSTGQVDKYLKKVQKAKEYKVKNTAEEEVAEEPKQEEAAIVEEPTVEEEAAIVEKPTVEEEAAIVEEPTVEEEAIKEE